jgi:hypothetical protein
MRPPATGNFSTELKAPTAALLVVSQIFISAFSCASVGTLKPVGQIPLPQVWMDRNLGASQVATSSTDPTSYGDSYQWDRLADGHQIRTSATTTTLAVNTTPGLTTTGKFKGMCSSRYGVTGRFYIQKVWWQQRVWHY